MTLFKTYTGNAMFNNALMTIEALGDIDHVSDITPELLLSLYEGKHIKEVNKRLKSYTMLFTKNGPLKNDPKNGDKIYNGLFKHILNNFENQGDNVCEISGSKYQTSFEEMLKQVFRNIGFTDKEISNKDTTVNRTWFPLIGSLGSDAQALPQARFAVQIHPICIIIMQFLPLASLLYKGGVLLVDSSNFEFLRSFVESNVQEVAKRIEATSSTAAIDNVKDFAKGNYLLKGIEILEEKNLEEEYSDLNLWSFSNSGTGASCEIERVPNELIKKLIRMKSKPSISQELKSILNRPSTANSFLQALEDNQEWYLLYPNVFGSGKKKTEYEGVSVDFLEAYFREIESPQKTGYAKYLARLIEDYKTDGFAKYLPKRNAWKEPDFKADLYKVLIKATGKGEWSLAHQLKILDDPSQIPIKNNFYQIHKIAHFYYYQKAFSDELPKAAHQGTASENVCEWLIALIQSDERQESLIKDLLSPQEYYATNYTNMFYRAYQQALLDLPSIFYSLYSDEYRSARGGVNGLLRIYFSQPQQEEFAVKALQKTDHWTPDDSTKKWFDEISHFCEDYQAYYFNKYENKETGVKPHKKYYNLIDTIPNENSKFLRWFYEAIQNTNEFLQGNDNKAPQWSEALLYDPRGEFSITFARFVIKFSLLKQYHHSTTNASKSHSITS